MGYLILPKQNLVKPRAPEPIVEKSIMSEAYTMNEFKVTVDPINEFPIFKLNDNHLARVKNCSFMSTEQAGSYSLSWRSNKEIQEETKPDENPDQAVTVEPMK